MRFLLSALLATGVALTACHSEPPPPAPVAGRPPTAFDEAPSPDLEERYKAAAARGDAGVP